MLEVLPEGRLRREHRSRTSPPAPRESGAENFGMLKTFYAPLQKKKRAVENADSQRCNSLSCLIDKYLYIRSLYKYDPTRAPLLCSLSLPNPSTCRSALRASYMRPI